MSSVLICPNPACKQPLSTSTLPGRFRCPSCGWILQIRFTPTGVVLQQATANNDSAAELPVAPEAPPTSASPAPLAEPVVAPSPRSTNPLLLYLMLGLLALVLMMGLAALVLVLLANKGSSPTQGTGKTAGLPRPGERVRGDYSIPTRSETVFQFAWSADTWSPDFDVQDNLQAALALKRRFPKGWLAIVVKDYGTRNPREDELKKDGAFLVGKVFEKEPEKSEPKATRLLDQPAWQFNFSGKGKDGEKWYGVCYALGYRGLGYWFIAGAGGFREADEMLKNAVQPGKETAWFWPESRKNWAEKAPETEVFKGAKHPLSLRVVKGQWKPLPGLEDFEGADLGLYGAHEDERFGTVKNNAKDGAVLVIVAKTESKTPKAALDEYVKKLTEEKVGESGDYKLAPVGGKDAEDDTFKLGGRPAARAELVLSFDKEPRRYYLIAVTVDDGQMYVVRCECAWNVRDYWKNEFTALLQGFKVGP